MQTNAWLRYGKMQRRHLKRQIIRIKTQKGVQSIKVRIFIYKRGRSSPTKTLRALPSALT